MFKIAERSSYETNNIYPNLSPTPSNNQQFRLKRINEIRDYLLLRLKKEN